MRFSSFAVLVFFVALSYLYYSLLDYVHFGFVFVCLKILNSAVAREIILSSVATLYVLI